MRASFTIVNGLDYVQIPIHSGLPIKCMFGFNSGAAIIDFRRIELILTCLVSQK
jgi:hypothetical protein